MIRLVLVDDHIVVRAGLELLLGAADDIEIVGVASDGEQAVEIALAARPDVILMDLSMPGVDGVEATRRICASIPDSKVLVLTSIADRSRILEAIDAGALGYLLKDGEPQDLLTGVRATARGETPLDPRAARALVAQRHETSELKLTTREREVLALVAQGLANKAIARRLGIAEKTVKAHLTSVFGRIGVTDRTQAALWAREHGLAV